MLDNHYLIIDNSCQWEQYIVKLNKQEILEMIEVKNLSVGSFLNNIYLREMHFSNKFFRNNYYYGWTISEYEFNRIKKMCELKEYVDEYNKLAEL